MIMNLLTIVFGIVMLISPKAFWAVATNNSENIPSGNTVIFIRILGLIFIFPSIAQFLTSLG